MAVVAMEPTDRPLFVTGHRVHLRHLDGTHGYIVNGPRVYQDGLHSRWEYRVVVEGEGDGATWQAERQLIRCYEGQTRWRTPDEFRRDLLLAKLRFRLTDTLYTYQASRTLFEPYQFRPVLRFLASQQQRLLIADEVGLGKTIEAAMIYLELKARLSSEFKRVLVVCPSRLRAKWQDELQSRFDEEFRSLNSTQETRHLLKRWRELGDAYRFRCIVSYEQLRSESLAREWAEHGVRLDLVIADEAHVMRNTTSLTHALGGILTDNADAAVFLTATPLMLGNPDLFNLLRLLAPEDYADYASFPEQVRPNEYVNQAAQAIGSGDPQAALDRLRFVEMTVMRERFLKDPRYQDVLDHLRALKLADGKPALTASVRLQRQILELNTLSAIFTRTRKREVANAKPRRAFTFSVALSPAERAFYDAFLVQVRRDLRQANGGAASFAIVMRERMAASCLAATRGAVQKSYEQHTEASLEVERSEFHLAADDEDELQARAERLRSTGELLSLSHAVGSVDAKFDLFEQTLQERLAQREESKALVFSYFRGTLGYLHDRLSRLGYRVGVIHGGLQIAERQKVIEAFRDDPKFRVLLSSEVGAEGLDFQFCDVLVNYDLPWNPMQVEQRIGRLDRFGQQADQIHIYNFVIEDTIETRIFDRLYQRINIFERSIGDLEAILGEEIRRLSLDVIRAELSPEQEIAEADKAAERIVARQQAAEELEQQQDQLVGQGAILDAAVKRTIDGGHVVFPQEVESLVKTFLVEAVAPPPAFDHDDEEDCWLLRINQPLGALLFAYTNDGHEGGGATDRFKKAVAEFGAVPLTFDAELARRRPLLELVTARHALAMAARDFWEDQSRCVLPATRIELSGPDEEVGEGHVFIHALVEAGLSRQARLHPVIVLDDGRLAPRAAETMLRWVASAEQPTVPISVDPASTKAAQHSGDGVVAQLRDEIQLEREQRNAAVVAARRAAITTSFDAKERSIRSALQATTNPGAVQMNRGRLHHLLARRGEKLAELEQSVKVSISSQLVALGRVRIVPANTAADATETDAPSPLTSMSPAQSPAEPVPDPATSATLAMPGSAPASDMDEGHAEATEELWPDDELSAAAESSPAMLAPDDQPSTGAADASVEMRTDLSPDAAPVVVSNPVVDARSDEKRSTRLPDTAPPPIDFHTPSSPPDVGAEPFEGSLHHPAPIVESPTTPTRLRHLHFPETASVGTVLVRGPDADALWEVAGPAHGTVRLPLDAAVRLRVDREVTTDLAWLQRLDSRDLYALLLDGGHFSGDDLRHLTHLTGLRELVLRDTGIDDGAIRNLQVLHQLTMLDLAGTRVTGLGMLYLKPLTALQSLDVARTPVGGDGLLHLSALSSLQELNLADTKVGDGSTVHLRHLTGLRVLDLRGTTVTEMGLRRIPAHILVHFDE